MKKLLLPLLLLLTQSLKAEPLQWWKPYVVDTDFSTVLQWPEVYTEPPELPILGYLVYAGLSPETYDHVYNAGQSTSFRIDFLRPPLRRSNFAVTAYTASGRETEFSADVFYDVPLALRLTPGVASTVEAADSPTGPWEFFADVPAMFYRFKLPFDLRPMRFFRARVKE